MESMYIHIPFCKNICSYCDFTKIIADERLIGPYLKTLKEEIKDKYDKEVIKTLYIGGGTPSVLNKEHLEALFTIIKDINLSNTYEFTFECNLNDINEELLEVLKTGGVNRLSIGIQSFNENKLKYMGRNHTYKEAIKKITLAREMGFININIDLMYGIPGETLNDLKKDLKLFLSLKPNHISTYSLIIESHTKLSIANEQPIAEEEEVQMYEYLVKTLAKKQYIHYELSNFALKGYESKHNLTIWDNKEYYGFGLGSHGFIHGVRYENTKNLKSYLKKEFVREERIISKTENMENELILGFRKIKGINLNEFYNKYDVNMQEVFPIEILVKNKDLIYKDGYISISPDKIYIMNEILLKLI